MSTEEVLNQIDSALRDTSVGPDGMRCNAPEPAIRPGLRGQAPPAITFVDESHVLSRDQVNAILDAGAAPPLRFIVGGNEGAPWPASVPLGHPTDGHFVGHLATPGRAERIAATALTYAAELVAAVLDGVARLGDHLSRDRSNR